MAPAQSVTKLKIIGSKISVPSGKKRLKKLPERKLSTQPVLNARNIKPAQMRMAAHETEFSESSSTVFSSCLFSSYSAFSSFSFTS